MPIKLPEGFYDFSPAISKWEAKTRYIKNYTLTLKQINRGFVFVKQLLLNNGAQEELLKLQERKLRDITSF